MHEIKICITFCHIGTLLIPLPRCCGDDSF